MRILAPYERILLTCPDEPTSVLAIKASPVRKRTLLKSTG